MQFRQLLNWEFVTPSRRGILLSSAGTWGGAGASRLLPPSLGKPVSILTSPCQHADSHFTCWTLGRSAPTLGLVPPRVSAPVFNHFLKLSITLQYGVWIASSRVEGKKNQRREITCEGCGLV